MRTHDDLDVTLTESSQKQEGAMVAPMEEDMEEDSVVEKSERVFRPERRASLMDLMPEDSYKTACRKDRVHVMGLDADELGDDGLVLRNLKILPEDLRDVLDAVVVLGFDDDRHLCVVDLATHTCETFTFTFAFIKAPEAMTALNFARATADSF